jgi:hypothetical protein
MPPLPAALFGNELGVRQRRYCHPAATMLSASSSDKGE